MLSKIPFFIGACLPAIFLPLPLWARIIIVLLIAFLPIIGSVISLAAWVWAAIIVFQEPFSGFTIFFIAAGIFGLVMNIGSLLPLFSRRD